MRPCTAAIRGVLRCGIQIWNAWGDSFVARRPWWLGVPGVKVSLTITLGYGCLQISPRSYSDLVGPSFCHSWQCMALSVFILFPTNLVSDGLVSMVFLSCIRSNRGHLCPNQVSSGNPNLRDKLWPPKDRHSGVPCEAEMLPQTAVYQGTMTFRDGCSTGRISPRYS